MLAFVSYDTNPGSLMGTERHASHWSDLVGGAWINEETEDESDARLSGLEMEEKDKHSTCLQQSHIHVYAIVRMLVHTRSIILS